MSPVPIPRRIPRRLVLLAALLPPLLGAFWACSPKTRWRVLNVLFDAVPPPESKTQQSKPAESPKTAATAPSDSQSQKPPNVPGIPSEKSSDWVQVEPLLPKDKLGNVDWVAALRAGTIAPWAGLEESTPKKEVFGFDLVFENEANPMFDAQFPHSVHTEWLACNNCHPTVFAGFERIRGKLTMPKVMEGEYCGRCHGKVAFPLTNCGRCHFKFPG